MILLDGSEWTNDELEFRMLDDEFYYGYLGKNMMSSSAIKSLYKSPKVYANSLSSSINSQALRDGKLIHLLVLEEQKLENLVITKGDKRTKEYKTALNEFGGERVYTLSELNKAERVANALKDNKIVADYLFRAEFEKPKAFEFQGLPFRAKADVLCEDCVIDIKTTTDLSKFRWSANNFGYDVQGALYEEAFGKSFKIIAIDKDSLDIGFFDCSDEFIRGGYAKIDKAISNYEIYKEGNLNDHITYDRL